MMFINKLLILFPHILNGKLNVDGTQKRKTLCNLNKMTAKMSQTNKGVDIGEHNHNTIW